MRELFFRYIKESALVDGIDGNKTIIQLCHIDKAFWKRCLERVNMLPVKNEAVNHSYHVKAGRQYTGGDRGNLAHFCYLVYFTILHIPGITATQVRSKYSEPSVRIDSNVHSKESLFVHFTDHIDLAIFFDMEQHIVRDYQNIS